MSPFLRHAIHMRGFQKGGRFFHESHKVVTMIVTEYQDDVSGSGLFILPGRYRGVMPSQASNRRHAPTDGFQEIAPIIPNLLCRIVKVNDNYLLSIILRVRRIQARII